MSNEKKPTNIDLQLESYINDIRKVEEIDKVNGLCIDFEVYCKELIKEGIYDMENLELIQKEFYDIALWNGCCPWNKRLIW